MVATPRHLLRYRDEIDEPVNPGEASAGVVEPDQARVGRPSRIDAMQSQAMPQASSRRRGRPLVRIEAALVRLDCDDYGVRGGREQPVDPRRPDIDPTARPGIGCAPNEQR